MATKLSALPLELKHFYNIEPYLKNMLSIDPCDVTTEAYLSRGYFQVSTVYEDVMAYLAGCTVVSEDTHDLSNGADCKITTARKHGHSYSAPIKDIKNKKGTLYAMCLEPIQHKFYYFAIPKSSYCNIPAKSNIEIPFFMDGTPRRVPSRKLTYANWWDYECDSLADMANRPGMDPVSIASQIIDVTYSMNYIIDIANGITA